MDRAVFDRAEMLERLGQDRRLERDLVESFLAASPEMLARVLDALAAGDAKRLERTAHGLRGVLLSVSAGAAAEAAAALEAHAREGDIEACADAARSLVRALDELEPVLARCLQGPP